MDKRKFKRRELFVFILLSVISTILTIRLSTISGDIINKLYDNTLLDNLAFYIFSLILFILLTMGLNTIKESFRLYIIGNEVGNLRSDLYESILNKDRESLDSPSYYHNILSSDVEQVRRDYLSSKLLILDSIILLFGASIYITRIHYIFLIISILSTFVPYIIPKLFEKSMSNQRLVVSDFSQSYISRVKEGVLGLETIRDYHIEDRILEDFSEDYEDLLKSENTFYDIQYIMISSSIFTGFLMYAIILSSGVYLYNKGLITVGAILVASQLTNSIKNPIISIINSRITINSTKPLWEKLSKELDAESLELHDQTFEFSNRLSVKNLSFSYDGEKNILSNVNLDFTKGKKYLILGESGSGKSTFFKILMKWLRNYSGEILVDGKDIQDIPMDSWNKEFVPVLQETYIFEKPMWFNISLEEDFDKKRMLEVIEFSGLSKFLDSLEDGLDTIISESGSNISGGEMKRIGIARALYKNGNVLLLDEPFSSLDKMTQNKIEEMVLNLEDKTIFNISHNIDENLLRQYDTVIYFKNGTVESTESKNFNWSGGDTNEKDEY